MKPLFLDDEIAENQRSDLESVLAPSQSQDEAPSPESKKLQVQDQTLSPRQQRELGSEHRKKLNPQLSFGWFFFRFTIATGHEILEGIVSLDCPSAKCERLSALSGLGLSSCGEAE